MYESRRTWSSSAPPEARRSRGRSAQRCIGNGWPKEAIDMLEKTQNYIDLYRDKIMCPQCNGVGSHEAYLDQVWEEMCEDLYDKYGFSIESGEGDPCDLFAVIAEDKE